MTVRIDVFERVVPYVRILVKSLRICNVGIRQRARLADLLTGGRIYDPAGNSSGVVNFPCAAEK
jgi:hypothetical protein